MRKERQEQILDILKVHKYVTVKYLTGALDYSTATINRDLNELHQRGLVKRSYGGVESADTTNLPPLPARQYYKMKEKQRIAHEAAKLICDGDTVFMEGGTTVRYIAQFLSGKKDLKVITNSMLLAMELSKYDMEIVCLGGTIIERPYILNGEETLENAMKYHADKLFFSLDQVTLDGQVHASQYLLHKIMIKNSRESYLLTDQTKIVPDVDKVLCDFSALRGVISDFEFPKETKVAYPRTRFICADVSR